MSIGRDEEEIETLNISSGDDEHDEQEGQEGDDAEDRGDEVDDDADIEELAKSVEGKGEDKGKGKEDDDDDDDDEQQAGNGRQQRVPYDRFRQVNDELKKEREERIRMEERLKLLEEQRGGKDGDKKQQPKAFDFDAAEDAYQDAVLEGDKEKARQIRAEIRAEEIRIAEAKAEERIQVRETLRRVDEVTAKAYEKYPFLNHESKEADKEAIDEVVEWRNFYHAKGDSWDKALQKAVDKVGKLYAPKEEPPAKKSDDGDDKKGRNVVDIKQRNAGVEKKIPPATTGTSGSREPRVDLAKLGDKEWADLSETEKKRFRGDIV